jgi:STE24 endopeptidase
MTPILILILTIIIAGFLVDLIIDLLNISALKTALPVVLAGEYSTESYSRSQLYQREASKFGLLVSSMSFVVIILMFILGGFTWVHEWVAKVTDNDIFSALLFFGTLMLGSGILSLPFDIWSTFVIEEKYGFNKTTARTFVLDKIKSLALLLVLGVPLAAFIIWIYRITGQSFWLWTWLVLSVFSLFLSFFYSTLIVPLFNKQKPLDEGPLRSAIELLAARADFPLKNIFVIDGSKRSSKSNAYFAGFGSKRRIVLYDTLIRDLEENQILAVLAHEIGHYRKKHILFSMLLSVFQTGLMLFLFSLVVGNPIFSQALNISEPTFHIGLLVFGILFSPVSELTGLLFNKISRSFEYQADAFAEKLGFGDDLASGLIRLSEKNLSNLTPHPAYVFVHYSHPTLLQRIARLERDVETLRR